MGQGDGVQTEPDEHQQGACTAAALSATEREQLSVQWQERLAGAAQLACRPASSAARWRDSLIICCNRSCHGGCCWLAT